MSMPTPNILAGKKAVLTVEASSEKPSKSTGFVLITEDGIHDGVVKAKHLKRGQVVRPFLHGEPKGSERVVDTVQPLGATVSITFSSPHPPAVVKAAYRYYDKDLAGTPLVQV